MSDEGKTETVAKAEYDKAIERARRFEGQLADLQKTVDRFKDIDPVEYKANKEALARLEQERAQNKPDEIEKLITKAKEETRKELGKKVEDYETKIQTLTAQNHELMVVDRVFSAASSDLNDDMYDIFKDIARRSCALDEEGNIVIKNDKGEIRYSPKNPNNKMTYAEFIEEIREKKTSMFKSTVKTGGKGDGTKSSNGSGVDRKYSAAELHAMDPNKAKEIMDKMTPAELKAAYAS